MSSGAMPAGRPVHSNDAILAALTRIELRLDRVESLAGQALSEGRGAIGMVTDTIDHHIQGAQARGVDLDARTKQGLQLLERITEPRVLSTLEALLGLAEMAPGALGTLTDTADHAMRRMQADGIDLDARLRNLMRAAERLSSDKAIATLDATFGRIDQIRLVLESGVFDPAAVAIVAKSGKALAAAAAEPSAGVGAIGLVRAIGETEVRAATGLLLGFARRLGASLLSRTALPSDSSHQEHA